MDLIDIFANYGFPGLVLGFSYLYIWQKDKQHYSERAEWKAVMDKQVYQIMSVIGETNKTLNDLHMVVAGLNTVVTGIMRDLIQIGIINFNKKESGVHEENPVKKR